MTLAGPFDNATGIHYLGELALGVAVPELEAVLDADSSFDLELAQEQYALSTVIAEMADPGHTPPAAADVAQIIFQDESAGILYPAAHDCMNRLLTNPFAALWKDHADGAIAIKRQARALRTRLHRACRD